MDLIKLVNDNIVWFSVAGIVIVMAIIGYFAEKTDFGRKKEQTHNKKEKAKPVVEAPAVKMPVAEEEIVEAPVNVETPTEADKSVVEVPLQEEQPLIESQEPTPEVLYEPELLNETGVEELPKVEQVEEVIDDEPEMIIENKEAEDINVPLPELDSLKENNDDDFEDDNDVWKF